MALAKTLQGPVILLGSLNLQYADEKFGPIRNAYVDTFTASQTDNSAEVLSTGTYPRRSWRIDYILVDKTHFNVMDSGIVSPPFRYASDHIAYWADVDIR